VDPDVVRRDRDEITQQAAQDDAPNNEVPFRYGLFQNIFQKLSCIPRIIGMTSG
jgi:hypothetical protein